MTSLSVGMDNLWKLFFRDIFDTQHYPSCEQGHEQGYVPKIK